MGRPATGSAELLILQAGPEHAHTQNDKIRVHKLADWECKMLLFGLLYAVFAAFLSAHCTKFFVNLGQILSPKASPWLRARPTLYLPISSQDRP
jgi:hypothetical protein